jgi:hypothetical protein
MIVLRAIQGAEHEILSEAKDDNVKGRGVKECCQA